MEVYHLTYPVKCPVCSQRVFDIVDVMVGCIEYKCPKCKKVSRYIQQPGAITKHIPPQADKVPAN